MANEALTYEALRRGIITPEQARQRLGVKVKESDKTKAVIAGAANAPAMLAGAAGDLATLATDAGQWIGDRIGDAAGLPKAPQGSAPPWRQAAQAVGSQAMRGYAGSALEAVGVADAQNAFKYQPETFGEKVAFAGSAGAVSPMPLTGALAGVGSEVSGKALEGTPLEMPARVAGGVLAAMGGNYAAGKLVPSTASQIADDFTSGYTPQQFEAAKALQADAAQMGLNLTGAEALQQAAGQQGRIGSLQYLVERSRGGGPEMERFLNQRPEQMRAASDAGLRIIGPDGLVPEQVAGRVQGAAVDAIKGAQDMRSSASRPYYEAANSQIVPSEMLNDVIKQVDNKISDVGQFSSTGKELLRYRNQLLGRPLDAALDSGDISVVEQMKKQALAGTGADDAMNAADVVNAPIKIRQAGSKSLATRLSETKLSKSEFGDALQGGYNRLAVKSGGVDIDAVAAELKKEGYPINNGDDLIRVLNQGKAKEIYKIDDEFARNRMTNQFNSDEADRLLNDLGYGPNTTRADIENEIFGTREYIPTQGGRDYSFGPLQTAYKETRERLSTAGLSPDAMQKEAAAIVGPINKRLRDDVLMQNPSYAQGRQAYMEASPAVEKLVQGNIGRIANDDKGIQRVRADLNAQEAALLDPATARPATIAQDVATLAKQDKNAPRDLLRVVAENKRNQAFAKTQAGENLAAGANFAKSMRGNPQARANLDAALKATGGDEAVRGFNRVLDALEATGKRQGANSRTAEMGEIRQDLTQPSIGQTAVRAPSSLGSSVFQAIDLWRYSKNTKKLAQTLTSPESVKLLQELGQEGIKEARKRQIMSVLLGSAYAQGNVPNPNDKPEKKRNTVPDPRSKPGLEIIYHGPARN